MHIDLRETAGKNRIYPMLILTENLTKALLDDETLFLLCFWLFEHEQRISDLESLLYVRGFRFSARATLDICRRLEQKGLLRCSAAFATALSNRFCLNCQMTLGSARLLFNVAATKKWLRALDTNNDYHWQGDRPAFIGMLASILNGGKDFPLPEKNEFYNYDPGKTKFWAAAATLAEAMSGDDILAPIDFRPALSDEFYRILTSVLFCCGRDVRPLLSDWRAKRASGWGKEATAADLCEYAALCFWTGRLEFLDVLPDLSESESASAFVAGCRAAEAGDFDEACRRMASVSALVRKSGLSGAEAAATMPACHLLALAVSAFHNPQKTRLSSLSSKACPRIENFDWTFPEPARRFLAERATESLGFATLAGSEEDLENVASTGWRSLRQWDSPICYSGVALCAAAALLGRARTEQLAPTAIDLAKRAVKAGYPSLAAVYLSAFGWAFREATAEEAKHVAETVDMAGGVWLRPFGGDSAAWKLVVDALDKCLPAAEKAARGGAKTKAGRIVWALTVAAQQDYTTDTSEPLKPSSMGFCCRVTPCFRGPRAADDGSGDKPVTENALLSGKYDGILTDVDRAVISELARDGLVGKETLRLPPAALKALCGHDRVTVATAGTRRSAAAYTLAYTPARLVWRDLPISVKSARDGGLAIHADAWCQNIIRTHAIRLEDDGALAVYAFPKAAEGVMQVFKSYGEKGTIEIPKGGVEAIRGLLPRLAALTPIQGDLAAVGSGANMERVAGDATPVALIEREGDTLALAVAVKPLPGSELRFVPGAGQPERLVTHAGRPAVLVRDLRREREGAARAKAALDDFESWSDGEFSWRIDSPEYALKALAALKDLGDAIRLEWRKGARISIGDPKPGAWKLGAVAGADFWFSVEGDFQLDDGKALELAQLVAAFKDRRGEFVPLGDGAYLRLTAALARRVEALAAAGRPHDGRLEIPSAAIPMLDGAFGDGADAAPPLPDEMERRAEDVRAALARRIDPPARLRAELRPYQRDGYEWLSRLASCGFGACLADDMGLGKTLQAIALLLERAGDGASLVVAPASVCGNWRAELARFAPTLRPLMAWDGKAGDDDGAIASAGPGDIVIAGYGLLVSREDQFASRKWNGVVLDEAQAIKNETTRRARAARRLDARFRVAATGTPVENRLTELWSIVDFLNHGLLGSSSDFVRRFTQDGRATPALKRLVAPFILRRLKRDVLDDLPEKTEITLPVVLGDEERAGYETCRRMALQALEAAGAEDRFSILAELTRLRRYCCHPSLVLGGGARESAKLDALLELLGNLRDNGHRALVFSQFTDYLAIVRRAVEDQGWTHLYLDGQTPARERERLVAAFQRGEGDFFLISLKAGGMGLNLTAASYAILLDPWWNPAVENQAADRVHRIGQKNPVTVYRLIAADTVEERVVELHREKKAIAEDVLEDASATALSPEQLMSLFR